METLLNPKKILIEEAIKIIDGEIGVNRTGVIITGLDIVCDFNNGFDGRKLFEKMNEFNDPNKLPVNLQEMREWGEGHSVEVVDRMLTSNDFGEQLGATLFYTDLVSRKVERNVRQEVASNFIDKLKKVEKAYEDTFDELDAQKAITEKAIKNEIEAKEQLSLVKRRADKQQRVADHKIAQLEKEIELLKAQLNK